MSTIALSNKAAKLMKLCDAAGFENLEDLLKASVTDMGLWGRSARDSSGFAISAFQRFLF
jgi:hypothetical protein